MPRIVRAGSLEGGPIADGTAATLPLVYFDLVRLERGEEHRLCLPGFESVLVVLSGNVDLRIGEVAFTDLGGRKDVWSGLAEAAYVPVGVEASATASVDGTEIAIAGGRWDETYEPFRIGADDIEMVDVGSRDTGSRRRIFHVLGQAAKGRVGNLLVSELYADPGCWSGYPPHKHDTEHDGEETFHEELYHYRFEPSAGFGGQFWYGEDRVPQAVMTRHGDTFLLDAGYHPTVTSPGHQGYIFTILVGKHQRPLVQRFDERHGYLMDKIPGLQAMRDMFSGADRVDETA